MDFLYHHAKYGGDRGSHAGCRPKSLMFFILFVGHKVCDNGNAMKLCNFYRAVLCISADYAVMRYPSVRPSVRPSVCHVRGSCQNELHIFEIFSPSGSHTILVFPDQTGWRYSDGNPPNGGVECKGGMKKSRFSTNIRLYLGTSEK